MSSREEKSDQTEDIVSWVTVDNLKVPCLVRDGSTFVAVRMMETKLLARYPSQSAQELHNMPPLASFYMTQTEAELLTSANVEKCSKLFGDEDFTEHDLIVKLNDFKDFYGAVKKLFSGKLSDRGGWCQVNNTIIPYIVRGESSKFLPLNVVRYAAGLLNNAKVPYVYPTEEECFLLNEKCKNATMNFVFTISTKLISLERVQETASDLKFVDDPKSVFPTTPAFPTSNPDPLGPMPMFNPRSSQLFGFPDMMPFPCPEISKEFGFGRAPDIFSSGMSSSSIYSDSLSTPRAALMLERMAAWSKLQEELHLNNIHHQGENNQGPSNVNRTPVSTIDQQSILQKIGVNVNIHLNGKFEGGQDSEQVKNKRKGQTPLRYSPSEQVDEDQHGAINRSPVISSLMSSTPTSTISTQSNESPLAITRQPPPMFNFRPASSYRPSPFVNSLSPHSGFNSPIGHPSSPPGMPPSSFGPFGHPPHNLLPQQGLHMWKYDYLKVSKY